jgi:hypothetical protein
MALAKKILMYISGIVALALVAVIIGAGYLILVPDSEIMGYHYLSGNAFEQTIEHTESAPLNFYNNLVINSGGFNLIIEPQNEKLDRIMVEFLPNAMGFTKEAVDNIDYSFSYASNTITFTVNTPEKGLMFYNNAYIKIGMPDITRQINLKVTSRGGEVTIGQKTPFGSLAPLVLETSDITIVNTRAPMTLQNFTTDPTGTLKITNKSGRVNILGEVGSYTQRAGDVILISEIGSFTFGTEEERYNIGGNLTIDAENAYVKAGNVGGNAEQTTISGYVDLKTVREDLVIDTKDSETKVEKVLGTVTVESDYNTIEIGQIGETLDETKRVRIILLNGNIVIGKCYYNVEVNSNRGDVTLNEVFSNVDVTTTYGEVTVIYNAVTSAQKPITNDYKTLEITTTDGNITAKNIKAIATLQVGVSSNATILAEFLEVNGQSRVDAGRREFTVKVPVANFNYEAITSTGGIEVLAGAEYKTMWSVDDGDIYNETTKKWSTGVIAMNGSVETNTDKLTITSSAGKINILNNTPQD